MASFKIFSQGDILALVNQREGEWKIGQKVQTVGCIEEIEKSIAKFVLLGIPEDIGVRANYGVGGAQTAWIPALKSLLNLQQNQFLQGEDILVLGELDIPKDNSTDVNQLRNTVTEIDDAVFPVIKAIVAAGKIPIVIGGGHNNCYPIIKGTSMVLHTKIAVFNIDAHADLRNPDEGRHSGNGFSTAIKDGYLADYCVVGLHQNYLSTPQLEFITKNNAVKALYFDDFLQSDQSLSDWAKAAIKSLKLPAGLEIDLDSLSNVLSSAATPSGFSLNQVRKLLFQLPRNLAYLHVCEGAYQLADGRKNELIGKTIAYLVSDFIKSQKIL